MEGRLAQMMPTPGSMTDQMLALTEVPGPVKEYVSQNLRVRDSVFDVSYDGGALKIFGDFGGRGNDIRKPLNDICWEGTYIEGLRLLLG